MLKILSVIFLVTIGVIFIMNSVSVVETTEEEQEAIKKVSQSLKENKTLAQKLQRDHEELPIDVKIPDETEALARLEEIETKFEAATDSHDRYVMMKELSELAKSSEKIRSSVKDFFASQIENNPQPLNAADPLSHPDLIMAKFYLEVDRDEESRKKFIDQFMNKHSDERVQMELLRLVND